MSANGTTAAPTGRKKLAQGKERSDAALGHDSQNTSSPEGARELPVGWRTTQLGQIGRWFGGGTPSKANPNFWTDGDIPWVSPKDMKTERISDAQDHITADAVANSATSLVAKGSVLVVVRSGILKHTLPVAITEREVALNQDLKAVTPSEGVRSDYLALALKAFERDILHTCCKSGTTVQNLEMPAFLRFPIPVAREPEQRRIVAEIEKQFTRLEAGVAALRRVQANLKRYRAAVLKAACEGQLVPTEAELHKVAAASRRSSGMKQSRDGFATFETAAELLTRILAERRKNCSGRGQYKEPAAPDTANLPPLPEGWTWATLDQLHVYLRNGWGLKPDAETGTPILRISANRPMSVNLDDVRFLSGSPADYAEYLVTEGDLLFTRYNGNPNLTGVCGVVPPLNVKIVHPDKLIRVQVVPKLCQSKFVGMVTNVGVSRDFLASRSRTTAGQTGISGSDLRGIPIPLPPLAEQTRIVAEVERRLSVVEELESVVSANLQRATRLRQSILQKAFTGQLIGNEG